MKLFTLLGLACAIVLSFPTHSAAEEPLQMGDKAPEIKVVKWVKGEPVTEFKKDRVYMVEFWATWCGPCIASMPHISQMQNKYKDKLTVIGVNIWERGEYADYSANVESFVADKGNTMGYTVAMDGDAKFMTQNWMEAAGRDGIPSSFIVNGDGVIAWIGHPMEAGTVIDQILTGTYDIEKAKKEAAERAENERLFMVAITKLRPMFEKEDFTGALKVLDADIASNPRLDQAVDSLRLQLLLELDHPEINTYAAKLAKRYNDSAMRLNEFAWTLAGPDSNVSKLDTDLTLKMAQRANELTGGKDGPILDTLAYTYYRKGDLANAIKHQTLAIEAAEKSDNPQLITELKERLAFFRSKQTVQ